MVIHILNDGSNPKDITGHVVKVSEAITLYDRLKKFNRRLSSDEKQNHTALRGKTSAAS